MTFGEAIACFYRGYVVWDARSTRAEYWWAILFYLLILVGTSMLDAVATAGVASLIWALTSFIGFISLGIRRLHDLGWSGWLYLVSIIPLIGLIVGIPQAFFSSKPYEVRWNRSLPKERQFQRLTSSNSS